MANKQNANKEALIGFVGIAVVIFISYLLWSGCNDDQPATNTGEVKIQKPIKRSPALQLAILDAGVDMPENDIRVNKIRNYLEKVCKQFTQPPDTIAEYTSRCQGMLYNHGIEQKCVDILHDAFIDNQENSKLKMKYQDYIILYVMMKTNQ